MGVTLSKNTAGYTDCKIYMRKTDDSASSMIGIDFGDLRLKTLNKLLRANVTPSRATDAKHLLKKLAEEIEQTLGSGLCLESPTLNFKGKLIRVEFPTATSDANKAKKALLAVLKKEFNLQVVVTK